MSPIEVIRALLDHADKWEAEVWVTPQGLKVTAPGLTDELIELGVSE